MSGLADLQEDVTPEQVADLHAEGEIQLIDIREPYEHEAGHIAGAHHIPLSKLTEEAGSLDRERPIVFYCRVGGRSAMATQAFRASGYQALNMTGGLLAWDSKGLPLEPETGAVADH